MIERYKHYTIEQEGDGSVKVSHPIYEHLATVESVEEARKFIDNKEDEANRRVDWTTQYILQEFRK